MSVYVDVALVTMNKYHVELASFREATDLEPCPDDGLEVLNRPIGYSADINDNKTNGRSPTDREFIMVT